MSYRLGVDLGTTYTAAAIADGPEPTMVGLGKRALQVPSVLFVREDGQFLVGEAAEHRGAAQPERIVREFKRRFGDSVAILVGGAPYSSQSLTARLLRWVVETTAEQQGGRPDEVVLTHPANWGTYKLDLLKDVAERADIGPTRFCPEPQAAAVQYAAQNRVAPGDMVAVYDLGGGTFDVCVLRKTPESFEILGRPGGVEHLGGADFDGALFDHVLRSLRGRLQEQDPDDPSLVRGLARLRRDCVEAKEALSSDVDAIVPVALPGVDSTVRITRGELEAIVRPMLQETLEHTERVLRSAGVAAADLRSILLVGGSSRIPLVSETLQRELGVSTAMDAHPKHAIALGAVREATGGARTRVGAESGKGSPPKSRAGRSRRESWASGRRSRMGAVAAPVPPPGSASASAPAPAASSGMARPAAGGFPSESRASAPHGPNPPLPHAAAPGDAARSYGPPPPAQPVADAARSAGGPTPAPTPPGQPFWQRLPKRPLLLGVGAAVATAAVVSTLVLSGQLRTSFTADPGTQTPATPSLQATPTASQLSSSPPVPSSLVPQSSPLGANVIVWPRSRDGNWDIALMDADTGTEMRQLTRSSEEDTHPVLSPDRQSILYVRRSPSGTSELRVMAADGGNERALFERLPSGCGSVRRPAWAPGDRLAIACPSVADPTVTLLKLVSLDGLVDVELDRGKLGDPTFCGGGTQVVYWRTSGTSDGGALYRVPAQAGATPARLTDGTDGQDADPVCSLDGSQIAFRRGRENARQIFVAPFNGTTLTDDPRRLTKEDNDQDPSWSPDGRRIAYKTGPSSQADVAIVDVSTGRSRFLRSESDPDTTPAWTSR